MQSNSSRSTRRASSSACAEEPLAAAQLRPLRRSLVHGELLAQGEVLESKLAVAAAEKREESKQMQQRRSRRRRPRPVTARSPRLCTPSSGRRLAIAGG